MNPVSTPYSYRSDPLVAEFDDAGPRTVMDAQCGLCSKGAGWIARNDRRDEFRIIPMQSELGSALMRHYDMDPADPTSWLYLVDGHAYTSLDAFIRVGKRLGGRWRLMAGLRIIPPPLQNALYGLVARNRLRFFGTTDLCAVPDPEIRRRLLQ